MLNDLLLGVAQGNEKAFDKLFQAYKSKIYAYAMHFTRSKSSSEEIVQEIFLKLWIQKNNLLQIERFEAYLYTITRNYCFDHLKKIAHAQAAKQEWQHLAQPNYEDAETRAVCNNYDLLVQQAMELLPPRQKKIYALSFYHGHRYEEIAKDLHISRNTVKVHLAKARSAIRKYIAARLDLLLLFSLFFFWH